MQTFFIFHVSSTIIYCVRNHGLSLLSSVDILSNNMTKMTMYAQAKGQLLIK